MISPVDYEKMEAQRPPVAVNNRGPTDTENGGIGVAESTHTKTCRDCGLEKPLDDFYGHPTNGDRHSFLCKPCDNERSRQRYLRGGRERAAANRRKRAHLPDVRERHRKAVYAERAKRPERYRARIALRDALREGRIQKPDYCQGCGATSRLHGHHSSYEPDHWLDVTWLCSGCHADVHSAMRAAKPASTSVESPQ